MKLPKLADKNVTDLNFWEKTLNEAKAAHARAEHAFENPPPTANLKKLQALENARAEAHLNVKLAQLRLSEYRLQLRADQINQAKERWAEVVAAEESIHDQMRQLVALALNDVMSFRDRHEQMLALMNGDFTRLQNEAAPLKEYVTDWRPLTANVDNYHPGGRSIPLSWTRFLSQVARSIERPGV